MKRHTRGNAEDLTRWHRIYRISWITLRSFVRQHLKFSSSRQRRRHGEYGETPSDFLVLISQETLLEQLCIVISPQPSNGLRELLSLQALKELIHRLPRISQGLMLILQGAHD